MDCLNPQKRHRTGWLKESDCCLEAFKSAVEQQTCLNDFPLAAEVTSGILVYNAPSRQLAPNEADALAEEWARAFSEGPGVICIRGAFASQLQDVDSVTAAFYSIIEQEKEAGGGGGDHFAKPGANSRIWNALEKLAVHSPESFVKYYSNPVIALAARAWLGPNYQVTSQANVVRPGGEAQAMHRDYHLGFTTNSVAEQYPAHVHAHVSPLLTLQGAVAHCDMPVETGPTIYLPHSQKYELGYLAWRRQEFKEYFGKHSVQVPLAKGDAVFFNPALFHAAGSNITTDCQRMANLLQISSAMGRAMETVDRTRVSLAIFPALLALARCGGTEEALANAIAASAEGYAFPTNLDFDKPIGGLAPESQADKLKRAVAEGWDVDRLRVALREWESRRCSR